MVPAEVQSLETLPGCFTKTGLRDQSAHHLKHNSANWFYGAPAQHENALAHPAQQAKEVSNPKTGLSKFFKSAFARFRPKLERLIRTEPAKSVTLKSVHGESVPWRRLMHSGLAHWRVQTWAKWVGWPTSREYHGLPLQRKRVIRLHEHEWPKPHQWDTKWWRK